jgi:hypothetical protein
LNAPVAGGRWNGTKGDAAAKQILIDANVRILREGPIGVVWVPPPNSHHCALYSSFFFVSTSVSVRMVVVQRPVSRPRRSMVAMA